MSRLRTMFTLFRLACLPFLFTLTDAAGETDPGLFHYVTRPDLKPPRWNVKKYDDASLAPGYWFIAPYKSLNDEEEKDGWIGPMIYDDWGELVWSGAADFENQKVEDFRISNVRGEQLMTFMHGGEKASFILDSNYTVREKVHEVANEDGHVNTHELQFVDEGRQAIVIETHIKNATLASSKAIGVKDGLCVDVHYEGFKVLDTTGGWKTKFSWSSEDYIPLEESLLNDSPLEIRCGGEWDYVHANSVDKTPAGNYLFSLRHTDTIYYIDGKTGFILWRLGGNLSDFTMDKSVRFSRQHDIRWRRSEGSRMWISMLDNAKGQDPQEPLHPNSRGLRLVLDLEKMTAEIDLQIEHPDGKDNYAFRRGNYQVIPGNGNIFMGWSERAAQSEHAPDGRLLLESWLETEWLGTYRSYKFPFMGRPITMPDAVSIATTPENRTETLVYASWNGATEIASWDLFEVDATGDVRTFIASARKTGFETKITIGSFTEYFVVAAMDKDATLLAESEVIKTKIADDANITMIAEEICAIRGDAVEDDDEYPTATQLGAVVAIAVLGYACAVAMALFRWRGCSIPWMLVAAGPWRRRRGLSVQRELGGQMSVDEPGQHEPLLEADEKER